MIIPERIQGFTAYLAGSNDILGEVSSVDLPELNFMAETVNGAGIAGEYESPTVGQYQSFTCTIHWRTLSKNIYKVIQNGAIDLDLRGSVQSYDPAVGVYTSIPVRMAIRGPVKNTGLGSLATSNADGCTTDIEIYRLKIWQDGEEEVEIDKQGYICRVDGVDLLEQTRVAMGMN